MSRSMAKSTIMKRMQPSLPVDEVLDELEKALGTSPAAILHAPPGSGKTTRVPLSLLTASWLSDRRILMLEPRRLAASNAARFMASLRQEVVGQTVGYSIRYERKVSSATRIEVMTEGLLTRRMQSDPELSGVGLVIFDEFHERSQHADLALALCRDIQQGLREDLRLLIMSATLESGPLAQLLGDCPVITAAGRSFPVSIKHLEQDPAGPLAESTASGIRRALVETSGDVLAFLPGALEIRRCFELLHDLTGRVRLHTLYGNLPFAEQEAAIRPGQERKVVLATNIAETSLTIEGVETVVDSGWERRPLFDPASGMTVLRTVRISRASAEQRSGRAGRLGPGSCYRLWSAGTHGALLPFSPPEILHADLAPLAFELACWGLDDPGQLQWLDAPPPGHLAAARRLLFQLGAVDRNGLLTNLGREMAHYPAHPRLARLLVESVRIDRPGVGGDLTAILAEPDQYSRSADRRQVTSRSDLIDRLQLLQRDRSGRTATARRAARFWRERLNAGTEPPAALDQLGQLLAAAYPDRLARQRQPGSDRYLLRNGQGAKLSSRTAVHDVEWLIAVEVARQPGKESLILQASALEPSLVDELFGASADWQREVVWDDSGERLQGRAVRRLHASLVQERPAVITVDDSLPVLLELVRCRGLGCLHWSVAARQLRARVMLLSNCFPEEGWPDWSDHGLLATLESWLIPALTEVRELSTLQRIELAELLQQQLAWNRRQELDQLAPQRLDVPSGSSVRVDYTSGDQPVLAVKLQEMFGLAETPMIAASRIPVLVHLLSPAGRPLAVTQDLGNFWQEVYPEVRKEMKGRYPKHPWPEDPWAAQATRKVKPRPR